MFQVAFELLFKLWDNFRLKYLCIFMPLSLISRTSMHCKKQWNFALGISLANETKSAVSHGFGHICWYKWCVQTLSWINSWINSWIIWYINIKCGPETKPNKRNHCVKSAQILSYFWSVFSCIQSKYKKIRTRNSSVFGHFSSSEPNCDSISKSYHDVFCFYILAFNLIKTASIFQKSRISNSWKNKFSLRK